MRHHRGKLRKGFSVSINGAEIMGPKKHNSVMMDQISVISNYLTSDSNLEALKIKPKKRSKSYLNYNPIDISVCNINELSRGYTDFFKKGKDLGSPIPANEILFSFQK